MENINISGSLSGFAAQGLQVVVGVRLSVKPFAAVCLLLLGAARSVLLFLPGLALLALYF